MNQVEFSIIVPVYNAELYLEQCINSILKQNYPFFEVILVDDGSSDRSGEICDIYAKKSHKVQVIHKKNGGASSARNAGIEIASKEYLIFIDSDDYLYDSSYLDTIAEFIDTSRPDLLIIPYRKYYEEKKELENYVESGQNIINLCKDKVLFWLVKNRKYLASACDKVVKTDLIKVNDIMFQINKKNEDIFWAAQIMQLANTVAFIDKSYYIYRQHSSSSSHTVTSVALWDLVENIKQCIDLFEQEQSIKLKKIYLSYTAYQYITFFIMIHGINDNIEKNKLINEMKKYRWLLQYDLISRVKIFRYIQKILGYKGLLFVTGIYQRIFYKSL